MKKYIIIISAAFLFLSCNKWMEEDRHGRPTADMFKDEANIIRLVGQAYADMKWLHDHWCYWGIVTLSSDEGVCPVRNPGGHWEDGGYWKGFATHNWTADDDAFENLWNKSMAGAIGCNKILQTLEENKDIMSGDLYEQYVGEVEVLRSYYFYTLFDCFGRIPYTEEFVETESAPLLTASEVWHKLVDCLEKNAPNMKVANNGNRAELYGRATQGFAYALLARLYLNAASYGVTDVPEAYQKCLESCDKIIDAGSYSIEDDFFTNFNIRNENSKENIFVIVENGDAAFDKREDNKMMNKLRIVMLTMHYSHQQVWNLKEKPWNGFCGSPELLATYDTADHRGPCPADQGTNAAERWGWFVGPVAMPDGTVLKDENQDDAIVKPTITSISGAGWAEGARLWKFEVEKEGVNQFCENDYPIFRYADILYMKAEAILRGASGNIDYSGDMQKIRTRAGVEAYNSGTLDLPEMLRERGREFAWELIRRRDLIRFGKYSSLDYWTGAWRGTVNTAPYREWFPLPNPVLERSNIVDGKHIWTQNTGY